MLRIRAEQQEVIRTHVLCAFKAKMVEHLRALLLPPCRPRSQSELVSLVEVGVERACGYGFKLEGSVCLFLELMFVFGDNFDQDPRHPWAAEILRRSGDISELDCADLLYDEAIKHLS